MQEPPLLATACPTRFKDRLSLEEVFSYGWFSGDGVPALCFFLQRKHVGTGAATEQIISKFLEHLQHLEHSPMALWLGGTVTNTSFGS